MINEGSEFQTDGGEHRKARFASSKVRKKLLEGAEW